MKYDIFISYRREGGDTLAQLIYDRLREKGYRVFLDIESLRSGMFNEKLLTVMEECKDVVVILPPNSLERCKNPEDWLYREVSYAIQRKKNIVPVMMRGFVWPEDLPKEIQDLQNFNGIHDSKDYFDAVIEKLCSLLTSKTDRLGILRDKLVQRIRKSFGQIRNKKKHLILITVILCILGGVIGGYGYYKMKTERDSLNSLMIRLRANENMSVNDFNESVEIVRTRMDILTQGAGYDLEVTDDMVEMKVPVEVFGTFENDAIHIIRSYISRPVDLYLMDMDTYARIELDKKDIISVENHKGNCDLIDLTDYKMEESEEYWYSEICFSEEAILAAEEELGKDCDSLVLAQDVAGYSTWYYYYLTPGEKDNQYYYVDSYQLEGINETAKYNYTHEGFEYAFYSDVYMPVDWEKIDEMSNPGIYQCNESDLEGHLVTVYYTGGDDATEGTFVDSKAMMKERLDALETPYAFGCVHTGSYDIAVRISAENLNQLVLENLNNSGYNLEISNPFVSDIISCYDGTYEVQTQDDGTYVLCFEASDDYVLDDMKTMLDDIKNSSNQYLYLKWNSHILAKIDAMDQKDNIQKGRIEFDSLAGFGMEQLDESSVSILRFLSTYAKNTETPIYYSCKYVFDDPDGTFGLQMEEMADVDLLQTTLEEVCSGAKIMSCQSGYLSIDLNLEKEDVTPSELVQMIKTLYQECGWNSGEWNVSMVCVMLDNGSLSFDITPDSYEYHQMKLRCWVEETELENAYVQEVIELLEEDVFFDEDLLYVNI